MSAPTDANTIESGAAGGLNRRWPFLLAGLAASAVTLARTIGGGQVDLPRIVERMEGDPIVAVVYINWHALSMVFAALALALFAAIRLPRSAARTVGVLATVVFGATCLLFMYHTHIATGSPFTFFPWLPLSVTALLCALAAWRG